MNKKLVISSAVSVLLALPAIMLAATFNPGPLPTTTNISVADIVDIIFSILWPITVAFFIIMFVLAAFLFATAQGDPEKIKQGRSAVIWGVVGVFVALAAFSIVFIVRSFTPF